jgi:uncharacterized membrane protein
MKNRYVGYLIIALGAVIGLIVYMFNQALSDIVGVSCSHGPTCTMWESISFQTNVSIVLMVIIICIGIYLVFFGKDIEIVEKIIHKTIRVKEEKPKKDYSVAMKELDEEERATLTKVIDSDGTIFQSQIVEDLGYPKAKVTRILDKLEGKGLIERRRRGMTNVVILKQ